MIEQVWSWVIKASHFAPISEHKKAKSLLFSSSDFGAMEKKNIIGPQVRKIRASQGLSQDALATKCNIIGWDISRGTLAKIESQVRRVTDSEVALIAKALKIRIQDLYTD